VATETRRCSGVSLHAFLAAAALLAAACAPEEPTLLEQGLPEDLPRYAGQLEVLKIPKAVTRLDGLLSQRLKRLVARDATDLKRLPALPWSLRELDIRGTAIPEFWSLPADLESFSVGGERIRTLAGLRRAHLLELTLESVPNLTTLADLPVSLQTLIVTGADRLTSVGVLPPRLKDLRLEKTQIRTLKGLPSTLRHMTLKGNAGMTVEFPPFLESLAVDWKDAPIERLAFLRELEAPSLARLRVLPSFLQSLQGPAFDPFLRDSAPSLSRLKLVSGTAADLPDLPSSLEELHWPAGAKLDKLPPGLKHLSIPYSPLLDLAALPEGLALTDLDISGTQIRVDTLPKTLQSLKFSFYSFGVVSGLPPALHSLDVSESLRVETVDVASLPLVRLNVSKTSIAVMPKLPASLEELDISNTMISSLGDLDDLKKLKKLRSLTLHAGQLESLAGLPESVVELYFVELQ
jgi:Leucine-rich repeat (LRR) protein